MQKKIINIGPEIKNIYEEEGLREIFGTFEIENKDKEIYKPVEFDLICFDGDYKHKINKFSGEGIRGTLIMNIEKI